MKPRTSRYCGLPGFGCSSGWHLAGGWRG
uniref:Uncharacterized protein n=1 Tax=Anguilla anguilla TaxID=7936 RepID=A0A0E9VDQ6_ANGAN